MLQAKFGQHQHPWEAPSPTNLQFYGDEFYLDVKGVHWINFLLNTVLPQDDYKIWVEGTKHNL